jgi:cellulase
MLSKIATIAAFAAGAMAHGATVGVTIDGKYYNGYDTAYYYNKQNNQPSPEHTGWYAENLDNGFIEPNSFSDADIICHKAGSPEGSSDTMAKVAAGGTVEFHWNTWPESHVGPVITYVAPYTGDVASVDKTALKWSKIDAHGYDAGEWAAVKLIGQNNTWPVTVPAALAAGKYVFRHEIIALHAAGSPNGAQAYPQCLNIEVTGDGASTPTDGVVGTELYKADDEGIVFNPYAAEIKYTIPGPKLWTGAGAGGSAPAPAPTPAPAPAPTTPGNGTATPVESAKPTPTIVDEASATPVAPETPGAGLPKTFTMETFIAWLEGAAKGDAKARRHARSFF